MTCSLWKKMKKQNTLELHSISKRALKARDSRIKMNRKKTSNSKKQHKNLNSSNTYAGSNSHNGQEKPQRHTATTTNNVTTTPTTNSNSTSRSSRVLQDCTVYSAKLSQPQPNSAKLAYSGLILHALSLHLSVCLAQAKRALINMRRHLGYPEAA